MLRQCNNAVSLKAFNFQRSPLGPFPPKWPKLIAFFGHRSGSWKGGDLAGRPTDEAWDAEQRLVAVNNHPSLCLQRSTVPL